MLVQLPQFLEQIIVDQHAFAKQINQFTRVQLPPCDHDVSQRSSNKDLDTPDGLYQLAAQLIQHGLLSVQDIYEHVCIPTSGWPRTPVPVPLSFSICTGWCCCSMSIPTSCSPVCWEASLSVIAYAHAGFLCSSSQMTTMRLQQLVIIKKLQPSRPQHANGIWFPLPLAFLHSYLLPVLSSPFEPPADTWLYSHRLPIVLLSGLSDRPNQSV